MARASSHCHLKPTSLDRQLRQYLRAGDLLLNLSVDVSSHDLVEWCAEQGVLYVDTSIEPWPGVFDNPMFSLRERRIDPSDPVSSSIPGRSMALLMN